MREYTISYNVGGFVGRQTVLADSFSDAISQFDLDRSRGDWVQVIKIGGEV